MKNLNTLLSISSVLAFVLLISCNIEPYEDDAIDDENVKPTLKTCEETSQDLTDAALEFVNVTSTNYTDLCGAYKEALRNQISACGDADGTLQTVIDGLGDCNGGGIGIGQSTTGDVRAFMTANIDGVAAFNVLTQQLLLILI